MTAQFSLGIDLGTSNCAMALTDFETDRTEVLPITQTLAVNQLGEGGLWRPRCTCRTRRNSPRGHSRCLGTRLD